MANNIYQIITDRIIEQLEQGVIPWHKPWTGGIEGAYNYTTGHAYSILNQMLLKHADAYLTWKQIHALGGKVKKGAKTEIVTFWKSLPIEEEDKDGNKVTKNIPFLRYYPVFWIGDTEGIERKEATRKALDPITEAEAIINGYMTSDNHPILNRDKTTDKACYCPTSDTVTVPTIEQYKEIAEYYSTLFHELTHSTGHATRLNRLNTAVAHFGNEEYSKEELVAEIGAATLVNMAGIETEKSFKNSAAYIQNWVQVLRNNVKMIVEASSKAAKAVDYITQNKPETVDGGDNTAPENKPEKPAKKTNTAKVYAKLEKAIVKEAAKKNPYADGLCAGMYRNNAYACNGHYLMKTSEQVTERETDEHNATTLNNVLKSCESLTDKGSVALTLKEVKEGVKAAKNGKRGAKVVYTTPEGITLNADYLINAMEATGAIEYRYSKKSGKRSTVIFQNDTTTFLVLPINNKNAEVVTGFKTI